MNDDYPDLEYGQLTPCIICGQDVGDEGHSWHNATCAVLRAAEAATDWSGHSIEVPCSCDGDVCAECCPVCAAERMIAPIRAHLQWVQDTVPRRTP